MTAIFPRALTPTELSLIRMDNQASELFLAIHAPATVFTALVNQTFTTDDSVVQITYDSGVGTLAQVLTGMTMWVSALGYGQCELGQVRIRKAPTSTIFYLGECSDIPWADDLYLTIKDEFGIWQRDIYIDDHQVAYMDRDIAYSDQHAKCSPVPCLGPRLVPAWIGNPYQVKSSYAYGDPAIIYTGAWTPYGGYEKYSNTTNDHADFSFAGNRVIFNGVNGAQSGKADIYLDGSLVATIDQYQSGSPVIVAAYDSGVIAQGTHTIRVVVKGTKNPSSAGYYIAVNGFDIYSDNSGSTLCYLPFDASASWVLSSSISTYLWTATGSASSAGMTTSKPTIIYDTPGLYRVDCKLTAANGKIESGHVYVQVFDQYANQPITQFDIKNGTGSRSSAGWEFEVTLYDQADFSMVVDRAMVCLFARDFYGPPGSQVEQSIGPIEGCENIKVEGWIMGESIVQDPDGNSITFKVQGVGQWMKSITGFPVGIQNVTKAPTRWTDWQGLTVDDSLYQLFYWQSTIIPAVDVFLTGDTRVSTAQTAGGDTTLADQMTNLLKNTILGDYCSDRFNRLFCEIDEQLVPPADRSTIPVVMTLDYIDWRDQMKITRIPLPVTSQVNLSGVATNLPNTPKAYFSLAPGHAFSRWGASKQQDHVLLSTQIKANQLAAMLLAWDNHQLEFELDLAGNNPMVDIVPHQFVAVNIAEADTPRGFTYSGHIIIRQVDFAYDSSAKSDSNFIQYSWQGECETFPGNSATGDSPKPGPPIKPPPIIVPPVDGGPGYPTAGAPSTVALLVRNTGVFYTTDANTANPHWFAMNDGIDVNDIGNIIFFDLSQVGGGCWLLVDGFTTPHTGNLLYYASGLGEAWSVVMTVGDAETLVGFTPARVMAIGINQGASDDVMAIIGDGMGGGSHGAYWCPGSSGGFTKGSATIASSGNGFIFGNVVYGNGQWTAMIGNGVRSYIEWCDHGGGSPNYNTTPATYNSNGDICSLYHAGIDGPVFYAKRCYKSNAGADIIKSLDNGATFSDADSGHETVSTFSLMDSALGVSPDGMFLMSCDPAGFQAHKSSDGGATWGNIGIAAGGSAFFCYGASNLWIMVSGGMVYYSVDSGDTWHDITGDLQTWLGGIWGAQILRGWETQVIA